MKLRFGSRSWLIAGQILIALFSGPVVVASVWLLAAIAAETGFVVSATDEDLHLDSLGLRAEKRM